MSKTKKNLKTPKTIKKLRKANKSKKRIHKGNNYINFHNIGSTEIIYKEGNLSPKKTIFKWNGNYDGNNAKIHMDLNVDGKKTKTDINLTNNQIKELLGANNVVDNPIDQRLIHDFSMNPHSFPQEQIYISPLSASNMPLIISDPLIVESEMISTPSLIHSIKKNKTNKTNTKY